MALLESVTTREEQIFVIMSENAIKVKGATEQAKKFALQFRVKGRKKKIAVMNALGVGEDFIDIEASLAIWQSLKNHSSPTRTHKDALECVLVSEDASLGIKKMERLFSLIGDSYGFLFPSFWMMTGALILDAQVLSEGLDRKIFEMNDEMTFTSVDLRHSITLRGDRTGTAEYLNELKVSLFGADWVGQFKVNKASTN